jgi:hypothetical protein
MLNCKFHNTRSAGKPKQDQRTSYRRMHYRTCEYVDGGNGLEIQKKGEEGFLREARAHKWLYIYSR